jgi:hypothetical protein
MYTYNEARSDDCRISDTGHIILRFPIAFHRPISVPTVPSFPNTYMSAGHIPTASDFAAMQNLWEETALDLSECTHTYMGHHPT